jgi:hypothetical protein
VTSPAAYDSQDRTSGHSQHKLDLVSNPDELWQEAERLERAALHADDLAAELRAEARMLPDGLMLARQWITESVWESPVADQARALLNQEAAVVCEGATDLVRVAMELEQRADELRRLACQYRRQAEVL